MRKTYAKMSAWKRPSEIDTETQPSLYGTKGIRPAAIDQGELGSCWFLSVCAALAEWPERVNKIFTNTEYSKEGIFELNLFLMGKPVKVTIDDRLPYKDK